MKSTYRPVPASPGVLGVQKIFRFIKSTFTRVHFKDYIMSLTDINSMVEWWLDTSHKMVTVPCLG